MHNDYIESDWQTKAKRVCSDANIAMTPKRLEVYTTLLKAGHPLSAYELIDAVKTDFARQLTPISIYRMLEFLEQKHLVRKLKSASKYVATNLAAEANSHQVSQFLICGECGEVKELGVDERLLGELKTFISSSGFQLKNLELELDCVCTDCSVSISANNGD